MPVAYIMRLVKLACLSLLVPGASSCSRSSEEITLDSIPLATGITVMDRFGGNGSIEYMLLDMGSLDASSPEDILAPDVRFDSLPDSSLVGVLGALTIDSFPNDCFVVVWRIGPDGPKSPESFEAGADLLVEANCS